MSYNAFTDPKNGYNSYANPSAPANGAPGYRPENLAGKKTKPPYGKIGDFTELLAQDGAGPYHINHFIGYFKQKPFGTSDLKVANSKFFISFLNIFPFENIASATLGKEKHKGNKTIDFKLGGNIGTLFQKLGGGFHSDWVSLQKEDHNEGFYASTLKRNWYEERELKAIKSLALVLIKTLGNTKNAVEYALHLLDVNQHHFLAGRRYFSIGYDSVKKMYFVETAAFERSSVCEYSVIDSTGVLRGNIVALWENLILNFKRLTDVTLIDFSSKPGYYNEPYQLSPDIANLPEGYYYDKTVAYNVAEGKSPQNLLKTGWFAPLIKKHPCLVKDFK